MIDSSNLFSSTVAQSLQPTVSFLFQSENKAKKCSGAKLIIRQILAQTAYLTYTNNRVAAVWSKLRRKRLRHGCLVHRRRLFIFPWV